MNATHKRGSDSEGGGSHSFAERRTIFCDLSRAHGDLAEEITAARWKIHHTNDTAEASGALYERSFEVGVVVLGNASSESIEQVETLLNTHPMNWIAIVEPSMIEDDRIATLISDHCFDYHTLPCDKTRLVSTLGHAYGMSLLRPRPAISNLISDYESQMVGRSEAMQNLFAIIKKSARVDAPVMITGETGTGKELVGRALHSQSPRNTGPFVTVSCATVPSNLIGEELFGSREKGSGRIEQAIGGTLFLDSINDLPAAQQMLLLRFMQTGQVERLNTSQPIPVDVRLITACSNNIDDAVKNGQFREDLFYRLNILHIEIPALRDRLGDVDSLAQYFLEKFIVDAPGARIKGFSQQAKIAMHQHSWPGNVRELLNRVRQSIVMCDSTLIQPADLGLGSSHSADNNTDAPTNLDEVRAKAEGDFIRNALERNYNNVTETASQLGVSRVTLYRLMKKYGVNIAGSGRRASSK